MKTILICLAVLIAGCCKQPTAPRARNCECEKKASPVLNDPFGPLDETK